MCLPCIGLPCIYLPCMLVAHRLRGCLSVPSGCSQLGVSAMRIQHHSIMMSALNACQRRLAGATALSLQRAAAALASIPWGATMVSSARGALHLGYMAVITERLSRCSGLEEAAAGFAWAASECAQCLVCPVCSAHTVQTPPVLCAHLQYPCDIQRRRGAVFGALQAAMIDSNTAGATVAAGRLSMHTEADGFMQAFHRLCFASSNYPRYTGELRLTCDLIYLCLVILVPIAPKQLSLYGQQYCLLHTNTSVGFVRRFAIFCATRGLVDKLAQWAAGYIRMAAGQGLQVRARVYLARASAPHSRLEQLPHACGRAGCKSNINTCFDLP